MRESVREDVREDLRNCKSWKMEECGGGRRPWADMGSYMGVYIGVDVTMVAERRMMGLAGRG